MKPVTVDRQRFGIGREERTGFAFRPRSSAYGRNEKSVTHAQRQSGRKANSLRVQVGRSCFHAEGELGINISTHEGPNNTRGSRADYSLTLIPSWSLIMYWVTFAVQTWGQEVACPSLEWQQSYDSMGGEPLWGSSVKQTTDDGYIAVGSQVGVIINQSDIYLIKTDSAGNQQWVRKYGGTSTNDFANSVEQTADRGYIVAGSTCDDNGCAAYIIKTDAGGKQKWAKRFGQRTSGKSIDQTEDGGYIVAGSVSSSGYLFKISATGVLAWDRELIQSTSCNSVQQTLEGGYIVTGPSTGNAVGDTNILLIKTNGAGEIIWERPYGGDRFDYPTNVQQTLDGGYIVGGTSASFGDDAGDFYLIKVHAAGNLDWQYTFGGPNGEYAAEARQSIDGGYILAGTTRPGGGGHGDVLVVKTDGYGNLSWQRTFGGQFADGGEGVAPTRDGGYVVAGGTQQGDPASASKLSLLKLRSDVNCATQVQLQIFQDEPARWLPLRQGVETPFDFTASSVVIVHGWKDGLTEWTTLIGTAIKERFRVLSMPVNVLGWDWRKAAEVGIEPAASAVYEESKKLAGDLRRLFKAGNYKEGVHLIGHSLGASIVTFTAIHMWQRSVDGDSFPINNVTLLDPPDVFRFGVLISLVIPHSLDINVPVLRTLGTYVDCFSGSYNDRTYFSNSWVVVGDTHNVDRWYLAHIATSGEPVLQTTVSCNTDLISKTVGFGISSTHANASRRLEVDCTPDNLGVALVAPLNKCEALDYIVYGEYCVAGAVLQRPILTSVSLAGGIADAECECTTPIDISRLRMRLRAQGEGGGAGDSTVTATYSLTQVIPESVEYLEFKYFYELAPSATKLTFSVEMGSTVIPIYITSSKTDQSGETILAGPFAVTQFRGKEVSLIFALSAAEAGSVVEISDLTYNQGPFHDNHSPAANAGGGEKGGRVFGAVAQESEVQLDGGLSMDTDGDQLFYVWTEQGKVISTDVRATLELPLGTYQLTLTVRDPFDCAASDNLIVEVEYPFIRGDSNADGSVNISDAVLTLRFLFVDDTTTICEDAADTNDDGALQLTDAVYVLNWLFLGGSGIPAPNWPTPSTDPSPDRLGCVIQQP